MGERQKVRLMERINLKGIHFRSKAYGHAYKCYDVGLIYIIILAYIFEYIPKTHKPKTREL